MDLRLMVFAACAIVGAVLIAAGLRLVGSGSKAERRSRPTVIAGLMFAVLGAACVALVGSSLLGPRRDGGLGIFPMSVLDLNAPAEAVRPGLAPQPKG